MLLLLPTAGKEKEEDWRRRGSGTWSEFSLRIGVLHTIGAAQQATDTTNRSAIDVAVP